MTTQTLPNPTKAMTRSYVREMYTRAAPVNDSSIDEEARTVRATLTTERPVAVYDWRTRRVIDEVLTTRGAEFPAQLPLYDSHYAASFNQFGSVRSINQGDGMHEGTLHFARNAGPHREEGWEMVRQKHVTDVSIGYSYGANDYQDIPPGERAVIDGKEYVAAAGRVMRVVTKWRAREVSTVPTGADDQAKIRSEFFGENEVDTRTDDSDPLKKSTEPSTGTRQTSTSEPETMTATTNNAASENTNETPSDDQTRGEKNTPETGKTETSTRNAPVQHQTPPVNPSEIARLERQRIREIENYRGQIDETLLKQATDEDWPIDKIRNEFNHKIVEDLRNNTPIHRNDRETSGSSEIRELQAAFLMRFGFDADSRLLQSSMGARALDAKDANAGWMVRGARALQHGGNLDETTERAFSGARRRGHMSMMKLCRCVLEAAGQRVSSLDDDELITRAISTSALSEIFTTAFNASFMEGFMGVADTSGWVRSIEVPNFQAAERIQMGKYARLTRRIKGNNADDGNIDAKAESIRVYEYASRFLIDEQDMVDDRFGRLTQATPEEMGEAAALLRPELVYGTLLDNPALASDSTALFHADHGNLAGSAALSLANIQAAANAMDTQVIPGTTRLLGTRARTLLVPTALRYTAKQIINSQEVRDTTANTLTPTINPIRDDFDIVAEPRLSAGCELPLTNEAMAGEPTNWYLIADGARHGLEVAYLSGRGQAPRTRRLTGVNDGYAMGWNIDHTLGVSAVGFEGIFKRTAS